MTNNALTKITIMTIAITMLAASPTLSVANASVSPPMVDETVLSGHSFHVDKQVTTPPLPPKLDLLLLEDETGSFFDDIETMQGDAVDCSNGLANDLYDGLDAQITDFRAAVAGFRDFDQSSWGSSGDWVYRLLQDLTNNKATWLTGICSLTAGGGLDFPEAQFGALKTAADGSAWDSNGDGDFIDVNDTPAGQDPSWSADPSVTRVAVLVTDATPHLDTDAGGAYPGPSEADTITALNAEGIHVIVLATASASASYNNVATQTGGTVQLITSSSDEIVDAITNALEQLTISVVPNASDCTDFDVTFDPPISDPVVGDVTVDFQEWITVSTDTLPGEYHCVVTFESDDGAVIGEQEIWIEVPFVEPRTIGFWKNHPDDTDSHLSIFIGDFEVLDSDSAKDVMKANAKNAHDMLAAQLLAAKLNVWAGVTTCDDVSDAISAADAELAGSGYDGKGSTTAPNPQSGDKQTVNAIKDTLDSFNNNGCI